MSAAQWLALLAVLDTHPNCPPNIKATVTAQWQQARAQEPPPTQDRDQEQPPWQ